VTKWNDSRFDGWITFKQCQVPSAVPQIYHAFDQTQMLPAVPKSWLVTSPSFWKENEAGQLARTTRSCHWHTGLLVSGALQFHLNQNAICDWWHTGPRWPRCAKAALRRVYTVASLDRRVLGAQVAKVAGHALQPYGLQPYGYFYFDPDLLTSNNFGITIPIVAQMDII